MLEPLLGFTAPYRADASWNTSSELSVGGVSYQALLGGISGQGVLCDLGVGVARLGGLGFRV